MRNWLSGGLKDNVNLKFAALTGILCVVNELKTTRQESIFSGLNNLEVYTILDEPFRQYFGFTQDEVETLAEDYECKEKLPEIKEWYNGYYFGNMTSIIHGRYCDMSKTAAAGGLLAWHQQQ